MIRIVFLGSGFISRQASGTAQVALKIIEHIVMKYKAEIEITILLNNQNEKKIVESDELLNNCKTIVLPEVRGKFFRSSRQFYKFISNYNGLKFDILHFTVPRFYPLFWKFPAKYFVSTFHAAGDITLPKDKFIFSTHIYNLIAKKYWSKLSIIYAVSDFAVNEIISFYGVIPEAIEKIHIGTNSLWDKEIIFLPGYDKFKLNILIMGRWQKYKNVHTIISAIKNSSIINTYDLQLYVVGKSNQLGKKLVSDALTNFPVHALHLYDYLSDEHVKFLYNNVSLVIHPSINEGFGLPAFEAFGENANILVHSTTPAAMCLSSFNGVIVENLLDLNRIESAIIRGISVEKKYTDLRRKGLVDMNMTWQIMGETYVQSYKNLINCNL